MAATPASKPDQSGAPLALFICRRRARPTAASGAGWRVLLVFLVLSLLLTSVAGGPPSALSPATQPLLQAAAQATMCALALSSHRPRQIKVGDQMMWHSGKGVRKRRTQVSVIELLGDDSARVSKTNGAHRTVPCSELSFHPLAQTSSRRLQRKRPAAAPQPDSSSSSDASGQSEEEPDAGRANYYKAIAIVSSSTWAMKHNH